ncbi:type II toxin-antitoxin system PemK/MazF family toxin [Nonlabens antarcticus]|uniref:type II toxin-antitoxin system PemK/MazF family toxin n=1 Tax=Nonlabens antarcticus TaxID=392714 RepID=UPI001891A599|nr:type II toxin-antitoxin system PemK/MazF family toxin [Nonlabens antarcticus]
MKQREIYEAFLDPVLGSEQGGRRPVVIISGNAVNDNANTVIICPITTKLKNYHGDVILKPDERNGLKYESEILNIHMRSISKKRLKNKIGSITRGQLEQTINSMNLIFKY